MSKKELEAVLRSLDKGDGVTAEELCAHTGLSRSAVCGRLKFLLMLGQVEVKRGHRTNAVGRQYETFLYNGRKWRKR